MTKIYKFDIDGTICNETLGEYSLAKPYKKRIAKVNKLYSEGNIIIIETARGYSTGIDWEDFTRKQLKKWGVKHHFLVMGKEGVDIIVDDKARNAKDFFKNND